VKPCETIGVKVFISSVRRGLEEERDALPSLISALGHEPRRFEDYTAQPIASREACLRGVEEADAYLLLLGASYGEPLPDTGKSPTEEEFTVAKRRGIPILSFRKAGVAQDAKQTAFAARVEDYRVGLFRASFATTADLLVAAARGLSEVSKAAAPLNWRSLASPVRVQWEAFRPSIVYGALLEVHVIPITATPLLVSALSELANTLARSGRDGQLYGQDRGLDLRIDEDGAVVVARSEGRQPYAALRESRTRVLSVASQLPSDVMGPLLDQKDISNRIYSALGIAVDRNLTPGDITIAVALSGIQMLTEGSIDDLGRRSSATLSGMAHNADQIRLEPADQIPFAALAAGRREVADEFASRLVLRFRQPRR
jgi:hypothetical protein